MVDLHNPTRKSSTALCWLSSKGMTSRLRAHRPIGPYLEDRTTIDFADQMSGAIRGYQTPPGY